MYHTKREFLFIVIVFASILLQSGVFYGCFSFLRESLLKKKSEWSQNFLNVLFLGVFPYFNPVPIKKKYHFGTLDAPGLRNAYKDHIGLY